MPDKRRSRIGNLLICVWSIVFLLAENKIKTSILWQYILLSSGKVDQKTGVQHTPTARHHYERPASAMGQGELTTCSSTLCHRSMVKQPLHLQLERWWLNVFCSEGAYDCMGNGPGRGMQVSGCCYNYNGLQQCVFCGVAGLRFGAGQPRNPASLNLTQPRSPVPLNLAQPRSPVRFCLSENSTNKSLFSCNNKSLFSKIFLALKRASH